MMYYHINPTTLTIIAGPVAATSDYVRALTRCSNPELLAESALLSINLVPQVFPALTAGNRYTATGTVYANRVEMQQEAIPPADILAQAQSILEQQASAAIAAQLSTKAAPILAAVAAKTRTMPTAEALITELALVPLPSRVDSVEVDVNTLAEALEVLI